MHFRHHQGSLELEIRDESGQALAHEHWANPQWDWGNDDSLCVKLLIRHYDAERCIFKDFVNLYVNRAGLDSALAQTAQLERRISVREDLRAPWFGWPAERRILLCTHPLRFGDGVGNSVLAMLSLFRSHGIPCQVYAYKTCAELRHLVLPIGQLFEDAQPHDLLIYHYCRFEPFLPALLSLKCPKILYYHNLTPPDYFRAFDESYPPRHSLAISQLSLLAQFDGVLANSKRTLKDLAHALASSTAGREGEAPAPALPSRSAACPPVVGIRSWDHVPAEDVALPHDRTLLLYVGRAAPHKKLEDLLSLYREYHRRDAQSALLLVSNASFPFYADFVQYQLRQLPEEVSRNIHFLDALSDGQLKTVYQKSSAFVTMSEHEGFCMPLVEAMAFDLPIFAFADAAVRETLGRSGRVYHRKEFSAIAADIHRVLRDDRCRQQLIEEQRRRREEISRLADGTPIWDMIEGVMFGHARAV